MVIKQVNRGDAALTDCKEGLHLGNVPRVVAVLPPGSVHSSGTESVRVTKPLQQRGTT